jgi:cobalt-precorrin 5A hydrolase / precorrin-3B C17-methyltransferase
VNVLSVSITAHGEALAHRLPYPHQHGQLGDTVRDTWSSVDGLVLFASVGIAVRVIAPLLSDKHSDPAVVCVDETGQFVVPVAGGHTGGANALAREVAGYLGAQAVITTATDSAGHLALDLIPGFAAVGDIAGVTRRLLDGATLALENELGWPVPAGLLARSMPTFSPSGIVSQTSAGGITGTAAGSIELAQQTLLAGPDAGLSKPDDDRSTAAAGSATVVISDRVMHSTTGVVVLHPPSLVLGIGSAAGVSAEEVARLVADTLAEAGLDRTSVAEVATIDLKATEAGIVAQGWPMRTFTAAELAAVVVPNPSDVVRAEVGTPSVAEAAALLAAGPGATLVVEKHRSAMATVAVTRRAGPKGHLTVIGLGPGSAQHRTPAAVMAIRNAQVIIGYDLYVDQCVDIVGPSHMVLRSPIGAETARCELALQRAVAGERVALVCSGDSGVYAMASLVLELAPKFGAPSVSVVPGVTAALAAASVLGAPLGHDHAAISLSDLLTPWPIIERRIEAVASADFVVTFYNPRSLKRTWQLERALEILRAERPASTPVGLVTDVGRPTQRVVLTTLADVDPTMVDMLTCVVVGSSITREILGRMVTPRGYIS